MEKKPRQQPPAPPDPNDQSGSTGRDTGPPSDNPGEEGKPGTGANTGQGNYGQSGYGQQGYGKGSAATPEPQDKKRAPR